jgi:hypothetical protein
MLSELDRRRAHLASGGTIENYDRTHYPQWYKDKLEKSITNDQSKTNINIRNYKGDDI